MRTAVSLFTLFIVWFCSVVAAQAQLNYSVSTHEIRFDDVGSCSEAVDSFDIINSGTRIFPGDGNRVLNGFQTFSDSVNVNPGDINRIYVRFTGTSAGSPYRVPFIIHIVYDQNEIKRDTVWLIGNRLSGPCGILEVQDISGVPGTDTVLAVNITSLSKDVNYNGLTATFTLDYNKTLLVPTVLPTGVTMLKPGELRVTSPLRNTLGPVVSIPVKLVLGADSTSMLGINNIVISDTTIGFQGINGVLTLEGICVSPLPRLFNPVIQPPVIIRNRKGVVAIFSEKAQRIVITSVSGQEIVNCILEPQNEYSLCTLASGCYWLHTATSTVGFVIP